LKVVYFVLEKGAQLYCRQMKTRLGSTIATAGSSFRNDLGKAIAGTTPGILPQLACFFADARLAKTRREGQDILANARVKLPELTNEAFDSSLGIIAYFFSILKPEDQLLDVLDDLDQLQIINDNNRPHLETLLQTILEIYNQRYRRDIRIKTTQQNIVPTLSGIDWEIDLRSVLEKPLSIHDLAQNFDPKILGFTPVVVVKISIENDEEQSFCFQLNERSLNILKNQVLGMEKHFQAAKARFSAEKEML